MLKKAKIFFGLATGFLLLVICSPFFATLGFADDIDTVQTINSGTLSFVDIPENFSFDSLAASDESQASSYVPTEGASSTGDIIVQDLRFSGGFSLTVQATAFENEFNDAFECADFAFLTFNSADAEGVEESANIIPGTADVTAPYNADPLRGTYTAMTPTGDDPTVCEPVEILSANTESDQGRIGSWKLYPAYQLTVPPFAPPGTYASRITFTLVDDTTAPSPFGDGFAITSSTPANGEIVYYQSGSGEYSFTTAYDVPSYSGASEVDVEFSICDSSDFDYCSYTSLDDIYSIVSTDGGSTTFGFTEDYLLSFIAPLGVTSGSTIYHRLRLLETGGETIVSDNYYTFVATEDPVDGPTDAWDSGDDVVGGANDLGAPTAVAQTHGPHTLSDADYYDWFTFDLTNGETYNFAGVTGTGDTYALLYDSTQAYLDEDDDSGEDLMFSLDYTATSTSTHYLAVRCKLIATDCGYTLSYADTSGSGGDEWDAGDDTGAGATSLGAPTTVAQTHGPHTLSATDNYDWFSVNLTSGNQYIFEATSGSGDTYGQLYSDNEGTTQVASDDDSAGSLMFRVTYTPSSNGTYYFRARCFSVGNDCGYTLQYSYDGGSGSDDAWDPDDDAGATPTTLADIDTHLQEHGPHTLSATDTADWFRVWVNGSRTYEFSSDDVEGTVTFNIMAPDGELPCATQVATATSSGADVSVSYTIPQGIDGYYCLAVASSPTGEDAGYTLNYRISGGVTWQNAPSVVVSFDDVNSTDRILDMEIDSGGNIHAISDDIANNYLIYNYYNGTSWTRTTLDSDLECFYGAKLKLDASGNPGVAWLEYACPTSSAIYYKKFNGASWGSTITVDTALSATPGDVGFDFMKSGGDTNYPYIVSCHSDTGAAEVNEYTWNGRSFSEPNLLNDTDANCLRSDVVVDSSDNIHAIVGGNADIDYLYYNGSSWSIEQDIAENKQSLYASIRLAIDSNGDPRYAMFDENADYIFASLKEGGTWSDYSLVNMGEGNFNGGLDLLVGPDDSEWIVYFLPASDYFYFIYTLSDGADSWVADGIPLDSDAVNTNSTAAGDFYNGDITVLGTVMPEVGLLYDLKKFVMSNLP